MKKLFSLLLALMPGIMLSQDVKLTKEMTGCDEAAARDFKLQNKWYFYEGTDGARYYMYMVSNQEELIPLFDNLKALLQANNAVFDKPAVDESNGEPLDTNNIEAFYDDVMYGDSAVYKKWLLEPEKGDLGDRIEFRLMPATFHIIVRDVP